MASEQWIAIRAHKRNQRAQEKATAAVTGTGTATTFTRWRPATAGNTATATATTDGGLTGAQRLARARKRPWTIAAGDFLTTTAASLTHPFPPSSSARRAGETQNRKQGEG
eukprot:1260447-Rhodomonas_salina.1